MALSKKIHQQYSNAIPPKQQQQQKTDSITFSAKWTTLAFFGEVSQSVSISFTVALLQVHSGEPMLSLQPQIFKLLCTVISDAESKVLLGVSQTFWDSSH